MVYYRKVQSINGNRSLPVGPDNLKAVSGTKLSASPTTEDDTFCATPQSDNGLIPASLAKALVQSGKPYFDPVTRQAQAKEYYQGLESNMASLDPQSAYDALNDLVTRTHTPLAYKPKQYLFPWVDLQPSLRLKSVYSDQEVEFASPARGNRKNQVAQWLQAIVQNPVDPVAMAAQIALAEQKGFLNCEHAVPQIWADNLPAAQGDLHHLFTSDSLTNLERSNRRLSEFSDHSHPTTSGEGWQEPGGNRYEPKAGKGVLARATLYFLVRYPGLVGDKQGEYTKADIDRMIRWSEEDPVSPYEQHRNQAIFELQGNCNPFIDHPEWVKKVDFYRGLGSPESPSPT